MRQLIFFSLLSWALFANPAQAKLFSNKFVQFQLPEGWECKLDGSEWVCQSTDEENKRDAIVILAAKIRRSGMDELSVYEEHLKQPQKYTAPDGREVVSDPRYTKRVSLNSKTWIDSLHLQSELPDFYTRYLATVEADLGILVTFSVRKDKYAKYGPDIEGLVKSLKAFRKPGVINESGGSTGADGSLEFGDLGEEDPNLFPDQSCPQGQRYNPKTGQCVQPRKKASGSGDDSSFLIMVIVAVGVIGFILYKKKQQG